MNSKKTLMIISLALVLVIGGASVLYTRLGQSLSPDQLSVQQPQQQADTAVTGEPAAEETAAPEPVLAPDFTVYDQNGNEVQLSDYAGKPIVLTLTTKANEYSLVSADALLYMPFSQQPDHILPVQFSPFDPLPETSPPFHSDLLSPIPPNAPPVAQVCATGRNFSENFLFSLASAPLLC